MLIRRADSPSPASPVAIVAGTAVACLFAAGAILSGVDIQREPVAIPLAPFGWRHLVVIHAVAALPLAWAIALALRGRLWKFSQSAALVSFLAGLLLAWATLRHGAAVGALLESAGAGCITRHAARTAWCVLLEAPWCVLASLALRDTIRVSWNMAALALVVAAALPAGYLARFLESETALARSHWSKWRVVLARNQAQRLVDVGSPLLLGEDASEDGSTLSITPRTALARLESNCGELVAQIQRLRSGGPLDRQKRLLMADHLIALGEQARAEAALLPIAEHDILAAMRVAQVLQREERWRESIDWFQKIRDRLRIGRAAPLENPDQIESLKAFVYDSLAFSARELKDEALAEQFYHEALAELPDQQAHFHCQLGRHHGIQGRVRKSLDHLQKAHELAPDSFDPPESSLQRILSNSTPVGIFAPDASNYR